jgi:hypothetical protein
MNHDQNTQVGDLTVLLRAAGDGDQEALNAIFNRVYDELHALARL